MEISFFIIHFLIFFAGTRGPKEISVPVPVPAGTLALLAAGLEQKDEY
jgi:hypothetical protein